MRSVTDNAVSLQPTLHMRNLDDGCHLQHRKSVIRNLVYINPIVLFALNLYKNQMNAVLTTGLHE